MDESTLLQARGVTVSYGDQTVVVDVDLALSAGEAVALVGANGAGKSSLVRVLAGVLEPTDGQVRLGARELGELSRREVARQVAVVPQTSPPVFAFSVIEFVLMGFHARKRLFLPSREQARAAGQVLSRLGLDERAAQSVASLSGGEFQRAVMARAMVSGAPIWLLDEPTASLDMHHQVALLKQVREHVDAGGAALAVLHDLSLVHRFFDRVVVLDEGRVLADGPPDQALTAERVSRVFGVPMQRGEVAGNVVWVVA